MVDTLEEKEQKRSLSVEDFEKCFGSRVSNHVREEIQKYDFSYSDLSDKEYSSALSFYREYLENNLKVNGSHRQTEWEKGWSENWESFNESGDLRDLSPKYYNNCDNKILRFDGKLIKPHSDDFELNTHNVAISRTADLFMRDVDHIYDFGCGTGQNFVPISKVNSRASLTGADWTQSSGKILSKLKSSKGINCDFSLFNFFNPDYNLEIKPNSAVITVTALEQVGKNFDKFIDYLVQSRPEICIHVEPIIEFLNPESCPLDWSMYHYMKKRNYLDGLYKKLKTLEKDNIIKIVAADRIRLGGFWTEGLSTVVWKVK